MWRDGHASRSDRPPAMRVEGGGLFHRPADDRALPRHRGQRSCGDGAVGESGGRRQRARQRQDDAAVVGVSGQPFAAIQVAARTRCESKRGGRGGVQHSPANHPRRFRHTYGVRHLVPGVFRGGVRSWRGPAHSAHRTPGLSRDAALRSAHRRDRQQGRKNQAADRVGSRHECTFKRWDSRDAGGDLGSAA